MLRGALAGDRIHRSHELRVAEEFLEHARVLTAYRTVYHGSARSLGYGSRRPDRYRAVDDRQTGAEKLDIAGSLADKGLDLERVADVPGVERLELLRWRVRLHFPH